MKAVLPVAERMLRKYGEFYPYGGYMKTDGTVVIVRRRGRKNGPPKNRKT